MEDLESRMYAVHVTQVLPRDDRLRAGGKAGHNGVLFDAEPPSFRPTIHWSLGGKVQPHEGGSWEHMPYAAIAPLGTLTEQMASLYPHDTTVIGDFALKAAGVAFLVPEGTDTSHLSSDVAVKQYPPTKSLREATAEHIAEQGGWAVRTSPGDAGVGAPAYIGETQINDMRFFNNYLEANPHISYGPHTRSLKGEAFRFGAVDQIVSTELYSLKEAPGGYSPVLAHFGAKLARYHLEKLDAVLQSSPLPEHALNTYTSKRDAAQSWLNVLDCDEKLQHEFGVTLAGAPESMYDKIDELRHDKDQLWEYVRSQASELAAAENAPLEPYHYAMLGQFCSSMPRKEFEELQASRPEMFESLDMTQLNLIYALTRTVEMDEHAAHEGLEELLDSLEQLPEEDKAQYRVLLPRIMGSYLRKGSLRLSAVLRTFDTPAVSALLELEPSEAPMKTLSDLIRRHPSTRVLAEPVEYSGSERQRVDELIKIGDFKPLPEDDLDSIDTLAEAQEKAYDKKAELSFRRHYLDQENEERGSRE